jgi:alpha-beta hydrolase superfamily lysophospholipase
LYRKVIDELAKRNMRGIRWDLPGFGLADRPKDYDYSWTGLGRFAAAAVEALRDRRLRREDRKARDALPPDDDHVGQGPPAKTLCARQVRQVSP